jgi:hypothetical protein
MRLDRVNEGSFYVVTATFLDSSNAAIVPDSVRYKIDCETSGKAIRGWTSVTPAATVTITATASENAIVNGGNRSETKVMTIQADQGADRQYTSNRKWSVLNLQGIT